MSDYERYGDYDNLDDSALKKKSPIGMIFSILIGIFCIGVIGLIAFRLILFKNYPKSVSDLYFTDTLTSYYSETEGEIGALTQNIRAPYEDEKNGYFFAGKLIVIPDAGELQIAVRYNVLNLSALSESLSLDETLDSESEMLFSYRLVDNNGNVVSSPAYTNFAERSMYRYQKLVFDGVDLSENVNWIRLEIFLAGEEDGEPIGMICIYENNDAYSTFSSYRLSRREKP